VTCEGKNRGKTRLPETQQRRKPDNCVKGLGRSNRVANKRYGRMHCFPIIFTEKTTQVEICAGKHFFQYRHEKRRAGYELLKM